MTATQIAVLCFLAGTAGLFATIGLLHGPGVRRHRVGVTAPPHPIEAPPPRAERPTCPIGTPQELPPGPLTIAEAHALMQRHRICEPAECVLKNAAFRTLIEAGYMRDPRSAPS